MSASILVAYATRYGSTQEVAGLVAATLRESGLEVDLQPMRDARAIDQYRAVVLGAPLYMFHWHKDARRFALRHRIVLMQRPVAIFALGPVQSPIDKREWQICRAQLDQDLAYFPWLRPVALKLFGGRLEPTKLRFPENLLAKTMPTTDIRDWTAILTWTNDLATRFQSVRA